MSPAGTAIVEIHSSIISDDNESLSIYLEMDDGSTASMNFTFVYVCERAYIIEDATHAPLRVWRCIDAGGSGAAASDVGTLNSSILL